MRVKDLRESLVKLDRILALYEGRQVQEMLDDIYRKVAEVPGAYGRKTGKGKDFDAAQAAAGLADMQREEMIAYLRGFTKPQLVKIGAAINVKLSGSDRKDQLIALLISRFDFIELNKQMAERPYPAEGGFLQDVIDRMKN